MIGTTTLVIALVAFTQLTEAGVGCGRQATGINPYLRGKRAAGRQRVIKGDWAVQSSYPWLISQNWADGKKEQFCGGSLIRVSETVDASDIVLTAAHCQQTVPILVRAGLYWQSYLGNVEERNVFPNSTLRHPQYDKSKAYVNDILLLKLDKPIYFNDRIRPICLPASTDSLPLGRACVVAGWGRNDTADKTKASDIMKQVEVSVQDDGSCQYTWGDDGYYYSTKKICAASNDGVSSTCQGDSGGGLVCRTNDGYWVQHGILSFGPEPCYDPNYSTMFTRVTSHLEFIRNGIKSLSSIK